MKAQVRARQMAWRWALLAAAPLACAIPGARAASDGGTPPAGSRTLVAATLTTPHPFWREGKQVQASAVILVRLIVGDALEVLPKAAPVPLFLLGHGVCELVKAPLRDAEAIFACPSPAFGEEPVFWKASFVESPADLTAERSTKELAAAVQRGSKRLELPAPGSARTYRDLTSLQRAELAGENPR